MKNSSALAVMPAVSLAVLWVRAPLMACFKKI